MEDSIATEANNTDGYVPYNERPETYIVPVLFALIFVVGVLGNGVLILIFCKHKAMRSIPNTYIFNLAIGDIFVILVCVPFTSTVYTLDSWPYGNLICRLSEFVKDTSTGVSVFTLTALSADRYLAIVRPMRRLVGGQRSRVIGFTLLIIWTLAIAVALPGLLFTRVIEFPSSSSNNTSIPVCYPFPDELGKMYPKVSVSLKFVAYYALPLVIIATFYALMARHLLHSTKAMPGDAPGQHQQLFQVRARKKVAKTVLSFVVIFALCFFPSHVFMLWFHLSAPYSWQEYNTVWHAVRIVGFCLGFINSCINPIALYCVSGTFRKHFHKHLFCCCSYDYRTRRPPSMLLESTHVTHAPTLRDRQVSAVRQSHPHACVEHSSLPLVSFNNASDKHH